MPQTLLSLLALSLAAVYSLGQQQASRHSFESVVRDEFEIAVTGTLLHAMEFADSRAFDEVTTPANLRLRLGLPLNAPDSVVSAISAADFLDLEADDFADPDDFGRTPTGAPANCNIRTPLASPLCNDVSDLHSDAWQAITFPTPNGDPLPVEVRVTVSYVQGGNPDARVDFPTFDKLVEIRARSPILTRRNPGQEIVLRRVISFDPATAAEYLVRSLRRGDEDTHADIDALQAALAAAQATLGSATEALAAAQARASAAAAAAADAQTTVGNLQAAAAAAAAQATAAATALSAAQAAAATAQATFSQADAAARQAESVYNASRGPARAQARRDRDAARATRDAARRDRDAANAEVTAAQRALTSAQSAAQIAQAALAGPQAAQGAATAESAAAQTALAAAQAAVAAAQAAVDAAQAALNAAVAAGRR